MAQFQKVDGFEHKIGELSIHSLDEGRLDAALEFVRDIRIAYTKKLNEVIAAKDNKFNKLAETLGSKEAVIDLQQEHHNKNLEDLLLNKQSLNKIILHQEKLTRKTEPVYYVSSSNCGRSHFLGYKKTFLGMQTDTFWFNVAVAWAMTVLLYIALYYDWLRKILGLLSSARVKR
ncbi:MAG: hypothetical protein HC896_03175 [Bacteroidales bacterium]|nr:hypothetical protein [Bacteroidales bacterium]